jgi:hypothetical protein
VQLLNITKSLSTLSARLRALAAHSCSSSSEYR